LVSGVGLDAIGDVDVLDVSTRSIIMTLARTCRAVLSARFVNDMHV
jgi:hypothetical protein